MTRGVLEPRSTTRRRPVGERLMPHALRITSRQLGAAEA
jgi:hypothetical protein